MDNSVVKVDELRSSYLSGSGDVEKRVEADTGLRVKFGDRALA